MLKRSIIIISAIGLTLGSVPITSAQLSLRKMGQSVKWPQFGPAWQSCEQRSRDRQFWRRCAFNLSGRKELAEK
jgi:hypothetical protein